MVSCGNRHKPRGVFVHPKDRQREGERREMERQRAERERSEIRAVKMVQSSCFER